MDVTIRLNSTKNCRQYWSVLYYYLAYISIEGYFCIIRLKFKLPYSDVLVLLYF